MEAFEANETLARQVHHLVHGHVQPFEAGQPSKCIGSDPGQFVAVKVELDQVGHEVEVRGRDRGQVGVRDRDRGHGLHHGPGFRDFLETFHEVVREVQSRDLTETLHSHGNIGNKVSLNPEKNEKVLLARYVVFINLYGQYRTNLIPYSVQCPLQFDS